MKNAPGLPPLNDELLPRIVGIEDGTDFIARLPLANPLQAEVLLNQFLDSLIARPPAPDVYLNLLEQLRIPLCFVEEELAHRYHNKPLPLGDVEEWAFRQVIDIWRKVARAYAQCAQLDASADDPEHPLRVALILHRCLFHTGMVVVEHHRARRELPAGIWLELHGYYASAEEFGVALQPVADALDPLGRPTHCTAAYAGVLLMDLAGPYSLPERDQALVRRWAHHWSALVSIVPAHPGEPLPPFVIDLMQDTSLKPVADCLNTENIRRFDASRLGISLTQARQQLAQRILPAQIGLGEDCTPGQCRRLLERLAKPWTLARAARKFRRQPASGIARVSTGFESMHYLISGREFTQPENARIYSRGEFDRLFVFRHMDDPSAQLQIEIERTNFRPDDWEVVNQSASGFRLMRSLVGGRASHGQLLSLLPHDGERYFLAQICWLMQDRSGGLVAGVEALPGVPHAIAARAVHTASGHPDLFSRAFLLPAIPGICPDPALVLAQGWYQAGKLIELHDGEGVTRVELLHVLQDGFDFERVSFRRVA